MAGHSRGGEEFIGFGWNRHTVIGHRPALRVDSPGRLPGARLRDGHVCSREVWSCVGDPGGPARDSGHLAAGPGRSRGCEPQGKGGARARATASTGRLGEDGRKYLGSRKAQRQGRQRCRAGFAWGRREAGIFWTLLGEVSGGGRVESSGQRPADGRGPWHGQAVGAGREPVTRVVAKGCGVGSACKLPNAGRWWKVAVAWLPTDSRGANERSRTRISESQRFLDRFHS